MKSKAELKAELEAESFRPIATHYRDAGYYHGGGEWDDPGDDNGIVWLNQRHPSHCYMGGLFRIPDSSLAKAYLEVALIYHKMSDFCGGYVAHSPSVNVLSERAAWDTVYKRASDDKTGLMTLPDPGERSTSWWINYGYDVLARGLAGALVAYSTPSVIMAGRICSFSQTQRFYRAWENVTATPEYYPVAPSRIEPDSTPEVGVPVDYRAIRAGKREVTTSVTHLPAYKNPNSGNEVQWTNLMCVVRGQYDSSLTDDMAAHLIASTKWIRRTSWRNG
jgi:hypothetical protein